MMHAAKLESSDRLQRVDDLLANGRAYSTLEIIALANVCAVNSCIAELRANGREINCWQENRVWYYQRIDVPRGTQK